MPEGSQDGVRAITPEAARRLLESGAAVVVDVREPAEVAASGRIPGALLIPVASLSLKANPSSSDHDPRLASGKDVILYCAAGARAAKAGKTLVELGYRNVYNL